MARLTKENYLAELNDIRTKLVSFLEKIESGEPTYFKDVSLKLRILFCDKSGTGALFKTIEKLYDLKLQVFVKYSISEKIRLGVLPENLANGLVLNQVNSVVGWFDPERADNLMPLIDAVNKKDELTIEGDQYSYKDIFEAMADKMGGAHIDGSIPDRVLVPHSRDFLIMGLSSAERAIFDTAKASVEIIQRINEFLNSGVETDLIKKV